MVLMDTTVSAVKLEDQGMGIAIGDENGLIKLFDIRYLGKPTLEV
jgi:hypothetical protein